jgi:hypothetical protein
VAKTTEVSMESTRRFVFSALVDEFEFLHQVADATIRCYRESLACRTTT